jgi:hypothetical protein
LNPRHYHLALVPLIQSTGEPEIPEVTLDTFINAAVHWLQNKFVSGGEKKGLASWLNFAYRNGLDSYYD